MPENRVATGPMGLARWLDELEHRHAQTIQLGLERVQAVLERLAVQGSARVITVGGTNGKGSVCAFLEAIYSAAGYRVGCYSSPHFLRFNERVRINGQEVSDAELADALDAVERARQQTPLTYFEHTTLAAWHIFCARQLEVVILEVGLGGRLDAVNVFEPDCAVVTSVDIDHQAWLGETREQIGFEKAGIFRKHKPAVCSDSHPPQSLLNYVQEIEAHLYLQGWDFGFQGDRQQWLFWFKMAESHIQRRGGLVLPALRGKHQLGNAASALMVLELLREVLPISMQAVRTGLSGIRLAGRFQSVPGRPVVVLDVAHNEAAARVLSDNLLDMGFFPQTWAVCGMLADKAVEAVAAQLKDRIDCWLVVPLPGERAIPVDALAQRLRDGGAKQVMCLDSPAEALNYAKKNLGQDDRIVVFGSFLTVAAVCAAENISTQAV